MTNIFFIALGALAMPSCILSLRTVHSKLARQGHALTARDPSIESEPDIVDGVQSMVAQLQSKSDQLDVALEDEAQQEAVKSKALQVKGEDPMTWFLGKLKKAGKAMKKAVKAVYNLMKDWLADLCTWAAEGGLDDVVNYVKDGLVTGFTSVKEFLHKVWSFFGQIIEKTEIKEHLSSVLKKAHDMVKAVFGNKSESSLLALEQNQSSSVELDAADESFVELVQKENNRTKGIIKNSTVVEAIVPNKFLMFVLCVIIDVIGASSYALDVASMLGEVLDVAWAPLQAMWLNQFFDGSKTISVIGFLEEILPLTDVVPTASIAWLFSYNKWVGCGVFRKVLSLPDRANLGYGACPQSTLKDIASKGYKVKKSKSKGHLYLKCKHGSLDRKKEGNWQKASCVESECKAVGGWCFVKNKCGKTKGPCVELDEKDPLECNGDPKKKPTKAA